MIVGILETLGFKSATHERNLYRGEIDGAMVLVCRQVDDFAIATASPKTAETLIARINGRVTASSKGIGTRYNGIDMQQTRDYIKISCESFIDTVLQTHGWSMPGPHKPDRHDSVPITPDATDALATLSGLLGRYS